MKYSVYLYLFLFMLFFVSAGFADTESERGDFWLCPSVETALYSYSSASYGGAFTFGYGKGTSIGIKAAWFIDPNGISVLELNFLFRAYLSGKQAYSGSFIQFIGGPALFYGKESAVSLPSNIGAFSLGLSYGWRFLIKEKWFIEPFIRGGYPYLAGAGLCAGIHF